MNWASTLHDGEIISIIAGGVSYQLHFIGKVILVSWKLSLEGFTGISGNNMLTKAFPLVSKVIRYYHTIGIVYSQCNLNTGCFILAP